MSLSLIPQKAVKVVDPRLDLSADHYYAVLEGASKATIQPQKTSTASNSSQVFNVFTPSTSVVVSRRVLWKNTITLSITGKAPAGQPLLAIGQTDAARAFPLHQLCSNMAAQAPFWRCAWLVL
jgi:hypothetical protein